MKNTILGIIALGVLGACNSEPKDEVGRYVPSGYNHNSILDTKTGRVYYPLHNQIDKYEYVDIIEKAKPYKEK